ncbi:MAG: PKD domain-containing protein [Bacteroidales bacterium]|nr:PKD domain-containing protein [Bacteroidales bacterium]
MRRIKFIQILIIIFSGIILTAQNNIEVSELFKKKGEVYFNFVIESQKEILQLSNIISLDDVDNNVVFAYANKKGFIKFLEFGLEYNILPHPGELIHPKMLSDINSKDILDWDYYPTYDAYIDMMYQFQSDYPDLCEVFSIGQSVQGRELLFAKISDNISQDEGEAQFMYTATMHGDETAGYVLSLRLIHYLLSNYGSDPKVDNMIENLEIWINPLANPDGTYAGGNNSVYGATRRNANWVDLNRNYPDPEDGPHPDGEEWQAETLAFMELAENNHFVMSSNFHGGTEVCNYPWDTWAPLHADDDWWQYVCHEYADTAQHYSPPDYMDDYDDGITNGYQWYSINGGRQDYMNYFHQCREFTLELSNTKLLPASQLQAHWEYNYRSFLNYMEQTLFGISGTVTDEVTGDPLIAEVYIESHDFDSSWVYSGEGTGKYFRPIHAGNYDIKFSAPGYYPQTFENIAVQNKQLTILNVELNSSDLIADFTADIIQIFEGESVQFSDLSLNNPTSWEWTFEGGTPETSDEQNPSVIYNTEGVYDVTLTVTNQYGNDTKTIEDFITVNHITGIENPISENINIFPIPAKIILNISSSVEIRSVSILNFIGETIYYKEVSLKLLELNISEFQAGIYFIQINTSEGLLNKKIQIL